MIEFLQNYHLAGIVIGLCTFLVIGLFHPLVIKGEYYFGVRIWWAFLAVGIVCGFLAWWVDDLFWSVILGVTGFSSFWGIGEILSSASEWRRVGFRVTQSGNIDLETKTT